MVDITHQAGNGEQQANIFDISAELVGSWATVKIGDAELRQVLTVDGVSLWDVIAPSLAVYVLPRVLAQSSSREMPAGGSIIARLKPYLRCLRDRLRELQERGQTPLQLSPKKEGITRILFLSFEPRQIEALAPVMDVKPLTDESVEIVALGTKYQPAKHKIPAHQNRRYILVEDLFHGEITRQVRENHKWLRLVWQEWLRDKSFQKSLNYQSTLLWKCLRNDFLDLSLHTFPQLVRLLSLAELLMASEKPDIVVGADDCDVRARAFFLVAKKLGIPTLHVQYGMASAQSVNWKFMSTDRAAIFDDITYQTLTHMGLKGDSLIITGQPRFDRLVNKASTREKVCRSLEIDAASKLILFTSQPYVSGSFPSEEVRRQLISSVYRAAAGLPNTILVVKPHPDEDPRLHRRLRAKVSPSTIRVVGSDADTQEMILACDALVSFASTTLLEAIIADKPVVMVEIPGSPVSEQYGHSLAGLVAKSQEELSSILKSVFGDEAVRNRLAAMRQAFLAQRKYLDGQASPRVADLIFAMIAESHQREH